MTKTNEAALSGSSWQDRPVTREHRPTLRKVRSGSPFVNGKKQSIAVEFAEAVMAIGLVTCAGWFVPLTYHAVGAIYVLMLVMLSLRVGRWPVMAAAVLSGIAWNFVCMPPRMSFSPLDVDDIVMLGTFFMAALIGGLLTTRIRQQEKDEWQREQRATALFRLAGKLAAARRLDETARTALREADDLFEARTALLLLSPDGRLEPHSFNSLILRDSDLEIACSVLRQARPAGRFLEDHSSADHLYFPMVRAGQVLGVFVLSLPTEVVRLKPGQRALIDSLSAQIAMLVERENLCATQESEMLPAESERLQRTLLDCVSHELRTPLSVLRAAAEKIDTPDSARRTNLTNEIREATQRMDHLVANLLNQTRLESGRLKPELDWCEVQEVIGAARRAVGRELDGRPITFDIATDMPLFMADAVMLEQVLSNLMVNAARHTPPGTAITLSAGRERSTGRVFISISDDGPGIAAEMRPNLFQKFSRGTSRPAGGLGLGLSIVRGFTAAQGGEVVVSRSPAGGACFTIYLPHTEDSHMPNDEL